MPIDFQCLCGKTYTVRDDLAGKPARCKQCGQTIEVPLPEATGQVDAEAAAGLGMASGLQPPSAGRDWAAARCCDKSGFLFKHACDRQPVGHCSSCGRPVCQEHSEEVGDRKICSTCRVKQIGRRRRSGRDYVDDDWPYVYGPWHYSGYDYGHHARDHETYSHSAHSDPNDFTEADGESLAVAGSESFEADLTES